VTINTANKIGLVLFDGTGGQKVSLGVSSVGVDKAVSIYKPDGALSISRIGQRAHVTFSGTQGQKVNLGVSDVGMSTTVLS
jgi:hypothetical protein